MAKNITHCPYCGSELRTNGVFVSDETVGFALAIHSADNREQVFVVSNEHTVNPRVVAKCGLCLEDITLFFPHGIRVVEQVGDDE